MRVIGGKFRNRKISVPRGEFVRPTSDYLRELLFNLLRNSIEGAHFLDLFAGSGAVGIEALSRGAEKVTFVEANRIAIRHLKQNLSAIQEHLPVIVVPLDVFKALSLLEKEGEKFQIIFADPPYFKPDPSSLPPSDQVLKFVDQSSLLTPEGSLFIEDTLDKPSPPFELKTLTLVDRRRAGKTLLQHFQRKDLLP